MGKTFSIITPLFLALLFTGCYTASPPTNPKLLSNEARNASASAEIKKFNDVKASSSPAPMVLPSVYQNISPLSGKTISLSAENANLRQVLYLISQNSGLNLVVDPDVDASKTITLTLNKASTQDALDTVMDLSGCSYTLKGNMLYIKQYSQRTFTIPYVHTQSSFDSTLGGDMLGTGGSGNTGSVSGKFALNYKNPIEANDFYKQIETNVKELLSENGKFTINKFTGILVATDTKVVLDSIEDMLKKIKKSASRQVLIEAKILEVSLNDTHQLGVDWNTLPGAIGDFAFSQTLGLAGATAGKLSYSDKHMNAVLTALDTAGDIQTLSNPRIKVASGQSALITSGKLVPFWDLEVTPGSVIDGVYTPALYEYTRRDVLDGLSLGVTPKITEDGQIILNVIPVVTSIEGEKSINGIVSDNNGSTTTNTVASAPIMNIKEAGTIIYAKDNDLVLIGGLINNIKKDYRESVPVLGAIPYFGALFSRTDTKDEKRELVILLKLNLVEQ